MAEGQGGGEFFTPRSVVRLMVEIIEPHNGTVFDPACGSGGMFVQSIQFIEKRKKPDEDTSLYVYGQDKTLETVRLARMNTAVNGLRGSIVKANTYYEDPHASIGKFDYVLANPPFNVDEVNLQKVEGDQRFNTYGIPRNKTDAKAKDKGAVTVPNANYLWINLFATSLKPKGRAALVMANSASDARNVFTQIDRAHRVFSEEQILDIAMISRLHRGKRQEFVELVHGYFQSGIASLVENRPHMADVATRVVSFLRENNHTQVPDFGPVLQAVDKLIDAHDSYQMIVRLESVEDSNQAQHDLATTIAPFFAHLHGALKEVDKAVRHVEKDLARNRDIKHLKAELEELYREAKAAEYFFGHIAWLQERFPQARYEDVTGLCKLASTRDVAEQEYSLNPGRYVGVVIEEDGKTEEEFVEEMLGLNAELESLNTEARRLEEVISRNIRLIAGEE